MTITAIAPRCRTGSRRRRRSIKRARLEVGNCRWQHRGQGRRRCHSTYCLVSVILGVVAPALLAVKTLAILAMRSVTQGFAGMGVPVPASQPGHRADEDSVRLDTGGIGAGLRGILGAQPVAYLGRVSNTRSVREWAEGSRASSADDMRRLRTSY